MTVTSGEQFSALLRRHRLAAGLTQATLAERAGLSARGVQNLERAVARPYRETARRLADALGLVGDARAAFDRAASPTPRNRPAPGSAPAPGSVPAPGSAPAPGTAPMLACPARPAAPRPDRRPRATLPTFLTSFVGRERDVESVRRALAESRLVTLLGVGGCGKTRLAVESAAALAGGAVDGVTFVPLATVGDPALVGAALARALDLQAGAGGDDDEARLSAAIGDRALLLVLDNLEHLLPAAPTIARLLLACPSLRVLATSRAPLGIRGERRLPVGPLATPTRADRSRPAAIRAAPAVALFLDRARDIRADFDLTADNARDVAELCGHLDGIPLAIELAAAWVGVLTPAQILERLTDRYRWLTAGDASTTPHHQSLQAAIDWSYDLLSEHEQVLLERLAVFVGGWTLEAAEAVGADDGPADSSPHDGPPPDSGSSAAADAVAREAGASAGAPAAELSPASAGAGRGVRAVGGVPEGLTPGLTLRLRPDDVLGALTRLVDRSLVSAVAGPNGQRRFLMLETIREYASRRLADRGGAAAVCRRHRAYYLGLIERAEPALKGGDERPILADLVAEHDNLHAALAAYLGDAGGLDPGLRFVGAMWPYWFARAGFAEGLRWTDAMLARPGHASDDLRAYAALRAGYLAFNLGDLRHAEARLTSSLELCRRLGDRVNEADALRGFGLIAEGRDDLERARACYERSLSVCRAVGDRNGIGWTLTFLGRVTRGLGDATRAAALLGEALAFWTVLGRQIGVAGAHLELGSLAGASGDLELAASQLAEALARFAELGESRGMSKAHRELGVLAFERGDAAGAVEHLTASLALQRTVGGRVDLADTEAELARAMAAVEPGPGALTERHAIVDDRAARLLGSWSVPAQGPIA